MTPTVQDLDKLITTSNYATRFVIDLSIARTATPLNLVIPSLAKVNGLLIITKGTGEFSLTFKFNISDAIVGLPAAYFSSSEITDKTSIPFEFKDLIITNTAQTAAVNPVFLMGFNISA